MFEYLGTIAHKMIAELQGARRTTKSGLIGSDARSAGREETSFSDAPSTSFSGTRDLTTGESAGHAVTPTGTCSGQNC
jgi:hypothetical protein